MPVQRYFPSSQGSQIPWLSNFIANLPEKIPSLQGITLAEAETLIAELKVYLYLIEKLIPLRRSDSQSATTYRELLAFGVGDVAEAIPEATPLPEPIPAPAKPGVLPRLFAFVQRIKEAPGYTSALGEDLGIVGAASSGPTQSAPLFQEILVQAGVVILKFRKYGHLGISIESRREGEPWTFLDIDTTSPYEDTRPLKTPGAPEWREYRMRYWDGQAVGEWSGIARVTVGT